MIKINKSAEYVLMRRSSINCRLIYESATKLEANICLFVGRRFQNCVNHTERARGRCQGHHARLRLPIWLKN